MKQDLTFTKEEYLQRVYRTGRAMEEAGLDALIAYSVRNAQGPVVYLAGYEPCLGLHDVAYLVVLPGRRPSCALLTNAFWDHPEQRSWVHQVIISADFAARLAELLPATARRVGIAGYRFFPAPVYLALQKAVPAVVFEDASRLLMRAARIKSPQEIEVARQCARFTDAGGRAFLDTVRPGVNEREIQAAVERAIILAGGDGLSFHPQIYSGTQVAVGIGFKVNRTLQEGDQAQIDCGAQFRGYRGDLSRVTTVGKAAKPVQAIMETTARMYEAMLYTLRGGVSVAEVTRAGVAVARQAGLDACLYRSPNHAGTFLGHCIGCWYHEAPELHIDSEDVLESNMLVVLEPILGQAGVGGAKIEDVILVKPDGAERLSQLDIRTWSV